MFYLAFMQGAQSLTDEYREWCETDMPFHFPLMVSAYCGGYVCVPFPMNAPLNCIESIVLPNLDEFLPGKNIGHDL